MTTELVIYASLGIVLSGFIIYFNDNITSDKRKELELKYEESKGEAASAIVDEAIPGDMDLSVSPSYIIDWIVFLIIACVVIYGINIASDGDFGRIIVAVFPTEFEALGLKHYIESVSYSQPQPHSLHNEL